MDDVEGWWQGEWDESVFSSWLHNDWNDERSAHSTPLPQPQPQPSGPSLNEPACDLGLCTLYWWSRNSWNPRLLQPAAEEWPAEEPLEARTLRFGMDTVVCTTVVMSGHPAARGIVVHTDEKVRTICSTAGKTAIKGEGQRYLVAKGDEGPQFLRTRKADVRRAFLSMKNMSHTGHHVVLGPDCALAHKPKAGRTTHFVSTSTGWDHTVVLETPNVANKVLQDVIATKQVEKTSSQDARADGVSELVTSVI